MSGYGIYTAEALAEGARMPLRTVRYYVREGVIDPPLGRGPGQHFTAEHLSQLERVRSLRATGLSLAAIRAQRADPGLEGRLTRLVETLRRRREREAISPQEPGLTQPPRDGRSRIFLCDGVELVVSGGGRLPDVGDLVELSNIVRKTFGVTASGGRQAATSRIR